MKSVTRFLKKKSDQSLALSSLAHLMEYDNWNKIANLFTMQTFKAGATIYEQGQDADTVMVVAKGSVKITFRVQNEEDEEEKQGRDEKQQQEEEHLDADMEVVKITITRSKGNVFGNEGIVLFDFEELPSIRGGTAVASVNSDILILRIERMRDFFGSSSKYKELFEPLNVALGSRVVTTLVDTGTYDFDSVVANPVLWQMWKFEVLGEGDILFEEGAIGKEMYVVYSGGMKVVLHEHSANRSKKIEATIDEGKMFGEIGVLVDTPRAGTVLAETDSVLMSMGWEDFNTVLSNFQKIGHRITNIARNHVVYNFRKYQIPFFEALTEDQFGLLGKLCTIVQIPPGESIFDIGEHGDRFYMISSGYVGIYVPVTEDYDPLEATDYNEVCRIGPGRYFGELALVTDSPRCAAAAAISRCVILSISKAKFDIFFQNYPEAAFDFQIKLAKYKIQLHQLLVHPKGVESFMNHLKHEYSQENLLFWIEAQDFKKNFDEMDEETRISEFHRIYDKFVSTQAPDEINISYMVREEVQTIKETGDITEESFDRLLHEVLELMNRDSFPRYRDSPLFQEFLREMEVYEHVPEADQ